MSTNTIEDPDYNILKRQFTNFFDKQPFYTSEIRHLSEKGENRLILNINDIRSFDLDLANRLLSDPIKLIPPLEAVVLELSQTKSSSKKPKRPSNFKVGFEGSFGENMLIPRDIKSSFLTQLVCLEGIATKLTSVRPKRMETVHFCEQTKKFSSLLYGDGLSFDRPRTSATIPSKDSDGNPLQLEFGYSNFIDHQRIFVQDMPERSRAGQMPRNVEVVAENDLVDSCKAGDRVRITGVFRAVAWKASGNTNGLYRTVLIATNIKVVSQIMVDKPMTERDIKNIRRMSKKRDILDIFARSIASSLYGHEFVKKATVLLLLGGEEKNLENKTHIRGDINMLLMGDPSVGKSQLLRAIMQIAKLSISTTGKGSSGVGLTAAVLTDRETGERYLEAGATVLADRGVICIDEFDKMSEIDRTSIHEVMEQQTVTIAKAGIHTSLNARCSVVAAANPAYSSYDPAKSPQDNIPLPDSILSRFDVLFVVLDNLDPEKDRKIADHVLRIHRYKGSGVENDLFDQMDEVEENGETEIFERFDRLLHDKPFFEEQINGQKIRKKNQFFTLDFMRKYIEYAKTQSHPVLSKEATEKICAAYCLIRNREENTTLPITARYVETMIRFATAHAKLRLSQIVEEIDVEKSLEILLYSLGGEAALSANEENEMSDKENDVQSTQIEPVDPVSKKSKSALKKAPMRRKLSHKKDEKKSKKLKKRQKVESDEEKENKPSERIDETRKKIVMTVISRLTRRSGLDITVSEVMNIVNKQTERKFEKKEFDEIIRSLEESNKIMVADNIIHRI